MYTAMRLRDLRSSVSLRPGLQLGNLLHCRKKKVPLCTPIADCPSSCTFQCLPAFLYFPRLINYLLGFI